MYEYILYLFSSDWTLEEPRYLCQCVKNIFLHRSNIILFLALMMINDSLGLVLVDVRVIFSRARI